MKHCSRFIIGLAIFCTSFAVLAQSDYIKTLDLPLNLETQINAEESSALWTEDVSARTLYTRTYRSDDGQIKTRSSSRPINYLNEEGLLVPINSQMVVKKEGVYAAKDQPYPTYFQQNGAMMVSLNKINDALMFGVNSKINGTAIKASGYKLEGNTFEMEDVIPGVNKEITFRENGVKYNYILMQPNQGDLVFSEELYFPSTYLISFDKTRGKQTEHGWSGLVTVTNATGAIVATFHEPLVFDQNRKFIVASYRLRKENDVQVLELVVPGDWLDDSERAYPVIVDPIVTGPTTTWTGGQMPSCFMPTFNQDSIQVTIPGDITITELNITCSFYADPWTGAWMEDGAMYFSTDCGSSGTFTITGAAGQTAGTAYLDYYNIYNPLTCCFNESCNIQSFWLSYHLGRDLWGSGCNTTYIRYDPVTTSWPFEATVVGKTAEHTAAQWNVPSIPTCTNDCEVIGIAYVAFGVAPYTFTHPWSNDTIVQGTNVGCGTGQTSHNFSLTVPNCPVYCDTVNTSLTVPPPVIWDACGNMVATANAGTVPLKPTPSFNPVYDTIVCSDEEFVIDLGLCIPQAFMYWNGNGVEGWNDQIPQTLNNSTDSITMTNYWAYAELNGCVSDTIDVPVYIRPNPVAAYSANPDPIISGVTVDFTDNTIFSTSPGVSWNYVFGDGATDQTQNPTHMYAQPNEYPFCLAVMDQAGCVDTLCEMITVAPAEVHIPNIVTANNDGINDLLEFEYLEFYPQNHLVVTNRWGQVVYEAGDYTNDWNPSDLEEGTYFFLLQTFGDEKEYSGFFQLVKQE